MELDKPLILGDYYQDRITAQQSTNYSSLLCQI